MGVKTADGKILKLTSISLFQIKFSQRYIANIIGVACNWLISHGLAIAPKKISDPLASYTIFYCRMHCIIFADFEFGIQWLVFLHSCNCLN
jgi:hypothetical protein